MSDRFFARKILRAGSRGATCEGSSHMSKIIMVATYRGDVISCNVLAFFFLLYTVCTVSVTAFGTYAAHCRNFRITGTNFWTVQSVRGRTEVKARVCTYAGVEGAVARCAEASVTGHEDDDGQQSDGDSSQRQRHGRAAQLSRQLRRTLGVRLCPDCTPNSSTGLSMVRYSRV